MTSPQEVRGATVAGTHFPASGWLYATPQEPGSYWQANLLAQSLPRDVLGLGSEPVTVELETCGSVLRARAPCQSQGQSEAPEHKRLFIGTGDLEEI